MLAFNSSASLSAISFLSYSAAFSYYFAAYSSAFYLYFSSSTYWRFSTVFIFGVIDKSTVKPSSNGIKT